MPIIVDLNGGRSARAGPGDSPEVYTPYSIDWRFLPEPALVLKDFIRHQVVRVNNASAMNATTAPLWARTIGQRTLKSVLAAKILFIHVPKTGGTSISKILYKRNLPHYTAEFYRTAFGAALATTPTFAVLRHPVARLLSSYRFTLSGGTHLMASNRYERLRLAGLESFETFVDFLCEASARNLQLPSTFHDQATFVLDRDGRVMTDRLFCLDDDGQLSAALGRFLGVSVLPHLNASPGSPIAISARTQGIIRELFWRDFVLFDLLTANDGDASLKGSSVVRP